MPIKAGQAFLYVNQFGVTHYYLQREKDVLHTIDDPNQCLVNLVSSEYLASIVVHSKKITPEKFTEAINKTLTKLNLGEYFTP